MIDHPRKPDAIGIEDAQFVYPAGGFGIHIAGLHITHGQPTAIIGPSGAGKTTLLHLIAGILSPTLGHVRVDGVDLSELGNSARRAFRLTRVGLVFQSFELIDHLNVLDNVLLPMRLGRALKVDKPARQRALDLVDLVGLSRYTHKKPTGLSQGERQRVGVCRALITRPAIVLADEPTANLDPDTARSVVSALLDCTQAVGGTLAMVTHDHIKLDRFNHVVDLKTILQARPS